MWVTPVRHGGPSLTNESGEAITRPPRLVVALSEKWRIRVTARYEKGRVLEYTRKRLVSDVLQDIKSRIDSDR